MWTACRTSSSWPPVSLVRQEPVTNNNVVTYVVELITPNEPLSDFDDDEKMWQGPRRADPGLGRNRRRAKRRGLSDPNGPGSA